MLFSARFLPSLNFTNAHPFSEREVLKTPLFTNVAVVGWLGGVSYDYNTYYFRFIFLLLNLVFNTNDNPY